MGYDENRTSAKEGGKIAGNARKALEAKTGKKVVSKSNYLPGPNVLDVLPDAAPTGPAPRRPRKHTK